MEQRTMASRDSSFTCLWISSDGKNLNKNGPLKTLQKSFDFHLEILDCVEGKRKFEELLTDPLFSSLDQATKDLGESKWRYMGSIAISLQKEQNRIHCRSEDKASLSKLN
jgi:hypothetical protein